MTLDLKWLPGLLLAWTLTAGAESLSIGKAESLATSRDAGYKSLVKQSRAMEDSAVAAGQLPDPMISVGWLNLPVEDFNLRAEPMNQVKIGFKQTFPAGDSLDIKRRSAMAGAGAMQEQAGVRHLDVLMQTRQAWLELQYQQIALSVIQESEPLFEQLRDFTRSLYRTGRKSLSDVIRAELEVQRLKDREVSIRETIERERSGLARWVGPVAMSADIPTDRPSWDFEVADKSALTQRLIAHPAILAMDEKVDQLRDQVALARQQYKPAWTLEAGYSIRNAQRANGTNVSDLVSISASINLPLFTRNRQDRSVAAATGQMNALMDQRNDMLSEMSAKLDATLVRISRLAERIALHKDTIVPATGEQANAARMAYEANRADFAEVMRAYIARLDSELNLRHLQAQRLEAIATAWYLLPPATDLDKTHEK